jgi:sulfur dioxygenase
MFDKQSSTYSYLLGDILSGEAVLIDPVHGCVERDLAVIKGLGLTLKYAINTHVHDDHISGSLHIKHLVHKCQSVISSSSGGKADILLNDRDLIHFGARSIICLNTPGHTAGCCSFVLDDLSRCFTGDGLLIHGCGMTHEQVLVIAGCLNDPANVVFILSFYYLY